MSMIKGSALRQSQAVYNKSGYRIRCAMKRLSLPYGIEASASKRATIRNFESLLIGLEFNL